jgi:hypothetical protein
VAAQALRLHILRVHDLGVRGGGPEHV